MVSEKKKASNARYRRTAKGKASQARSNDKSAGKRFMLRYATAEELKEYQGFINQRLSEINGKKS